MHVCACADRAIKWVWCAGQRIPLDGTYRYSYSGDSGAKQWLLNRRRLRYVTIINGMRIMKCALAELAFILVYYRGEVVCATEATHCMTHPFLLPMVRSQIKEY